MNLLHKSENNIISFEIKKNTMIYTQERKNDPGTFSYFHHKKTIIYYI